MKHELTPIAIIGMGCRFPGGAENPRKFWQMLCEGRDGIIEVPPERWDVRRFYDPDPNKPGKTYTKHGAYLRQPIDQMDALFFGISPREAETLDPQQRLLLEVTWEALEDAGLVPKQLAGSTTGVFIGGFIIDHIATSISPYNRDLLGTYSAVSFTHTILSARIAYVLDLNGPCMTLDTACSSSLVAFHQACQSIRAGESEIALVGGVNVMHRPEIPISMCKSQLLAADGRSKSFDARGDGYGRGEGAGVVVLKPLDAAKRDGDSIYAVVRGTGINQDGRTEGITLPNGEAQATLIRQVWERSGVAPGEIAYFEAHGTGTAVGDPVECNALGTVLGREHLPHNPSEDACFVGSLKANIGHLEAAAGIASVIKSSLCLTHRQIPPVANLETPNPSIPFEALGLRLPRKLEPMPIAKKPAYVGINSFGYGGTNAHVVLEEAPPTEKAPIEDAPDTPYLLPLSARSEKALSGLAQSYLDFLSAPEVPPLRDICYSAGVRREHHNHRLALIADSRDGMAAQLQSFVGGGGHLLTGQVFPEQEAQPVFVFTGMGPQWWAMGRELLQQEPVFRQVAEECDAIFQDLSGWSILAEMKVNEADSKMSETHIAQPANFIVQAGLSALWQSWGIEPAAIVGHSVGDVTASYVSGILGLEDAMLVSYHRSRLQKTVAGQGKMLAVGLAMKEARDMLGIDGERVSFAAINSPASITLSGDQNALEEMAGTLKDKGIFNRFLQVELAYHSHIMDPLKDEFREVLSTLRLKNPAVPFYSTVLGQRVEKPVCDGEYWCNNIREPVLFAKSIENLMDDGHRLFLEVGPHPVLSTAIEECLAHRGTKGKIIASLHRKKPERTALREALGSLYIANTPIDFGRLYETGNYVRLPTYPWQRETYWVESEESLRDRLGRSGQHPLLGQRLAIPKSLNLSWETTLNNNFLPYLTDHRIEGAVIFPGAAYVEIGLAIQKEIDEKGVFALEGIKLRRALVIGANDEPVLHADYDEETREYTVHSRSRDDKSNWTLHATGSISMLRVDGAQKIDPDEIRKRCPVSMNADTLYDRLHKVGLQYGPHFQGIRRLWKGKDEVLARIEGHEALVLDDSDYRLHPTLLDAGFQSLITLLDDSTPYVPVSIRQLRFYAGPKASCWSHARFIKGSAGVIEVDITLCDDDGNVLVEVKDLFCQALAVKKGEQTGDWKQWTYDFAWEPAEKPVPMETNIPARWWLFSDGRTVGKWLGEQFPSHGAQSVIQVLPDTTFQKKNPTHFEIRRDSKEDMQRLLETVENGDRIVYLWGLDAPVEENDPTGTADTVACLHLIQALAEIKQLESLHFFLVTCAAQPIHTDENPLALAQSPLIGLVRVAINEHSNIHFHLVDIDQGNDINNLALLLDELLADSPDEEIALRGTERHAHRLRQMQVKEPEPIAATPGLPYELESSTPGSIEGLHFREKQRRAPGPGEIELEVRAASLNYKDVLKVKKLLLEETLGNTFYGNSLGMEAAGVITQVGEDVEDYQAGDAIIASLPSAFSSYITVPVDSVFLMPKPDNLSYEEAVGVPRVFVTAYYGLYHVARLQAGERVLIHAASGGVGMAAIQVAQWIGAEIFATVDSPEKSAYLRSLGIEHIMDFRSLEFVDQVMVSTDGKGADVIISALPGEIITKNLAVLAPFGRFIEIGKQDIVDDKRLPMRPFNRNLTFSVVDIDHLMVERPGIFRQMLSEIRGRFMTLDFRPLPLDVFPAARIVDAFNHMADSNHIGKIAISMRGVEKLSVLPMAMEKTLFKPDATYLITGGFGGFGLEVARWMSALGVRNLVLVGRSGAATEEARRTVEELEKAGTKVLAASVDIAQEPQVERLMGEIDATMPPLKGVMHAAAVLDDLPIAELDAERFSKVMAPKGIGAWHLHRYTRDISLDFFVLFSSISAQIGNANQANYVAANVFLDALAHHRRASGLPATSIDWGAISEVGMAARDKETGEYLEGIGVKGITRTQATKALAYILYRQPVQISLMHADWGKLGQFNPAFATSPRFAHLIPDEALFAEDSSDKVLRRALQAMEPEEREEKVITLLAGEISKTLRIPTDQVGLHHSLPNMGVDSLMAMELRTALQTQFGVTITMLELLKGDTITQMATPLLEKMGMGESFGLSPESHPDTQVITAKEDAVSSYVEGEI